MSSLGHCVREAEGMPVQDDERERQMVLLFNLTVPEDRRRADVDALLELDKRAEPVPFELKSSTGKSVSTVRDFGPDHIVKWRHLHWLFAFYGAGGQHLRHCYYASPADMADWITDRECYVRPDMVLAEWAPRLVTAETLQQVLGDAETFSLHDARLIMKNQWRLAEYHRQADLPGTRYSRERMIELLQRRCAYVIRRGATLNNPHIPEVYLTARGLQPIQRDHAARLRGLVRLGHIWSPLAMTTPARPRLIQRSRLRQELPARTMPARRPSAGARRCRSDPIACTSHP